MKSLSATVDRRTTELGGLALGAVALAFFQPIFPITLGPEWLLAAPFGLSFIAAVLAGFSGVAAFATGCAVVWGLRGGLATDAVAHLSAIAEGLVVAAVLRIRVAFSPGLERPSDVLLFAILVSSGAIVRGLVLAIGAPLVDAPSVSSGLGGTAIEWFTAFLMGP
ncbi:MAG: hypothetical protein JNK93_14035, partial [Planctomycetia bacterium]|nr:hypothetical protein [Planctomycetia bacterium]